jgi:hypothetical protein
MANRAMAIAPRIILAGVVAGAAAATLHVHRASAADDCLSKPKATAPAGQHWYYRSDRATKRQCWYLGDEASHGASLNVRKSAAAAAHRHHQELSQAAADAHAEFASPAVPATDAKRDLVAAAPAAAAAAPSPINIAAATPATMPALAADSSAATSPAPDSGAATADQSAVASRWPDATNAAQPVAAPSRNPATFTVAAADPAPAPAASVDSNAAAAGDSSAVDAESPSGTTMASTIDSSRTRLAAFLGAVALAGFSTSVLLARARARRRIRLEPAGGRRRQIWPADAEIDDMELPGVGDERPALASRNEPAPPRTARLSVVPRDDVRYDEQYEVEDLLARYGGQGGSKR